MLEFIMRTSRGNPKYNWDAVQAYYDEGNSYRECRRKFGFAADSWTDAVRRGVLIARARLRPLADVLKTSNDRSHIKRRLLDAGILKNECSLCGLSEWRGMRLSIQIDHINGVKDDFRIENLRMLCPNCHSQTATFGGRNAFKKQRDPGSSNGRTAGSEPAYRGSNP